MALVVLGGLLRAVVLNMLVVAALFLRYDVERSGAAAGGPAAPEAGAGAGCWVLVLVLEGVG